HSPLVKWNSARAFGRDMERGPGAFYIMSPLEISPPYPNCIVASHTVGAGVPLLATLYDLIPMERPDLYLRDVAIARLHRHRMRLYGAADLVLAISEHSRQAAIR